MGRKSAGRELVVNWWPQPKQAEFLSAVGLWPPDGPFEPQADEILYGGSAGGGKTASLLIAALLYGLRFKRARMTYFRRTYPELEAEGGPIQESHEVYAGLGKYTGDRRRWTFRTGSTLTFSHMEHEDDRFRHRGDQIDLLIFDETTLFTQRQYTYMQHRNRATVDGGRPLTLCGTNPGGVGHAFVRSRFLEPTLRGREVYHTPEGLRRMFVQAFLSDNQILEKRDPNYRKRLEALPEAERKALLEGNWDVFAGQFFSDWNERYHVVQPFAVPDHWQRIGAYDWGHPKPSVYALYALPPAGGAYCIAEYTTVRWEDGEPKPSPVLVTDQIPAIHAMEAQWGVPRYRVADPSIWGRASHTTGETIGETFAKGGLSFQRADNDRINGWMRTREWMKLQPGPTGEPEPLLRLFSHCRYGVWSIPTLIHADNRPGDLDTDGDDHFADQLRYFVMSRPIPSGSTGIVMGGVPKRGVKRSRIYTGDDDDDDRDTPSTWNS